MNQTKTPPRLAVDIGGTFTDLALEVGSRLITTKVLTTASAPEEGVLAGVEQVLAESGVAPGDVTSIIHGTTLATNALIERKGARTALVVTEGLRDSLEMAYENRFEQYDIDIDRPEPLVPRYLRLPVRERLDARGEVLVPLDEKSVEALLPQFEAEGIESVAVGLIHAYANPSHEQRVAEIIAGARPDLSLSLSCEVCPEIREYERQSTTCANAYVQPLMARYLSELASRLKARGFGCPFLLVTSGGGLAALETAVKFPVRLAESGPAGGAILAAGVARECGLDSVISYDMGGTTAKICLIDGAKPLTSRSFEVARVYRFLKGSGLPVRIPVIEMVEIGAGGGSIAQVDRLRRIQVGPESAGADPGPACYDRGGKAPTVTDADVALGRILPEAFAGGSVALSPERAAAAVSEAIGVALDLDQALAAFAISEMVDENMANATRVHAVEWGKDVTSRTLIAFGGAAPLHACRLAEKLGLDRVVVPTGAGVGSAIGFLRAPAAYEVVRSRYMKLGEFDPAVGNEILATMAEEAYPVVRQAAPEGPLEERRSAFMRYLGQGHEITVELPQRPMVESDAAYLQGAFDQAYEALYGRTIPGLELEILSWTLSVSTPRAEVTPIREPTTGGPVPMSIDRRPVFDPGAAATAPTPVYRRADLLPGGEISGPALIVEDQTTTVLTAGFTAMINDLGYLVLTRK